MSMLLLLFVSFQQKWYIPQGVNGFGNSVIQVVDTDRDGNIEFVFTTYGSWPSYIHLYELHLPDTWEVDSVQTPGGDLLWASGDFDADGFYDFVLQLHIENPSLVDGIMIFESPDSFSYPTQEMWRDTVGPPLVLPICVYDIDQDGLPEIVKNRATPYGYLGVYESVGDNQYDLIFVDDPDTSGNEAPAATIAFGDFDGDGSVEFVPAGGNEWYWIYECTGDNSYDKIAEGQLPTGNIRDCFSVPDADEDGKMEFVVKGFVIPSAEIHVFIFEATADNTYEIIDTLVLPGGDYYGGYSAAGDVDGDSVPEIVLEARQNVFVIKAGADDSFYVWDTLPGHVSGSSVAIYDVDENGYQEIVISGNDETRIYEYDPGGVAEARSQKPEVRYRLEVYPNPFRTSLVIKYELSNKHNRKNNSELPTIRIYDVTGRLVKQFSRLRLDAQRPTLITWYGEDDLGCKVPAGVYFVATDLKSGHIYTVKILKLK